MYRAEIERKELTIRFKDWSPVILSNNPDLAEGIDLMPVVRLLSLVIHENKEVDQAV